METIVNFQSFESRFKPSLIFSMYEGLKTGEGFRLICDQKPDELKQQFEAAKIQNIDWVENKRDDGHWEVKITKTKSKDGGGCCGICGGH